MNILSKATLFALLATFTLATGNCAVRDSQEEKSGFVSSVTMARDVKADKSPDNTTEVFKPMDTIHAVVRITDAPANTKVKIAWYAVDVGSAAEPDTLIETKELTTDGTRNVDFTLKPAKPLPVGTYEAEILINDDVDTTKSFSVK